MTMIVKIEGNQMMTPLPIASRELYPLGEAPPLGAVPKKMHASVIRPDRYGQPQDAFQMEVVDVPVVGDAQVLVYVMAAGVNYNNVWASLGKPLDVVAARRKAGAEEDFHIGGSDASGIVWAVGKNVRNVKVGDQVVLSCAMWDPQAPDVQAGADPTTSTTCKIWGFEENWGSFAQFTLVDSYQCLPRPQNLSWEASAAYMLVAATAYRQLMGWAPHVVRPGDPVLIWGGAGGLGCMAIQIVREFGGVPIAVVSDEAKFEYCLQLGARACINRKEFSHWGRMPDLQDAEAYGRWLNGARAFGKKFWEALGERRNPRIVFEHPGQDTLPTSIFVCDNGGMVVTCAGTTGYAGDVDLRYLWMRQKRFQGSHFANAEQCQQLNQMVMRGRVDPCLSQVFPLSEVGQAHQLMHDNVHPPGNMAIRVGATPV
jgi:crotonyl-CoA carboxylase/reductase